MNEIPSKNQQSIYNLHDIAIMISSFIETVKTPIILLDGIEYLITNNGFNTVMRFLQNKRRQIEQANGTLIIPIIKDTLELKKALLIEREYEQYSTSILNDKR